MVTAQKAAQSGQIVDRTSEEGIRQCLQRCQTVCRPKLLNERMGIAQPLGGVVRQFWLRQRIHTSLFAAPMPQSGTKHLSVVRPWPVRNAKDPKINFLKSFARANGAKKFQAAENLHSFCYLNPCLRPNATLDLASKKTTTAGAATIAPTRGTQGAGVG